MRFGPADTHAHGNGTAMTLPVLLLPGIGGSGPDHWQSHWERTDPDMTRFAPSDWDRPELADWCEALDRGVMADLNVNDKWPAHASELLTALEIES